MFQSNRVLRKYVNKAIVIAQLIRLHTLTILLPRVQFPITPSMLFQFIDLVEIDALYVNGLWKNENKQKYARIGPCLFLNKCLPILGKIVASSSISACKTLPQMWFPPGTNVASDVLEPPWREQIPSVLFHCHEYFEQFEFSLHLMAHSVTFRASISVTRWLNYVSIFGHFQQWKLAQKQWNNFAKVGLLFCQIRNKPPKSCQRLVKFWHSGEFSPNLVTLASIDSGSSSNSQPTVHLYS